MDLNISNVQHFSVGDGAGIRTTVFFKGCNLRCPWCHNPENLTAAPVTLSYAATGKTEVAGKRVSVEALLPELLEDKDFYDTSGGGVTLSGGEVLLQAEGAAALTAALKEEGVPVLIDTAGCVPYGAFEALAGLAQGYLYDFKTAEEEKYRQIGGDLRLVTENLERLLASEASVQVRIPLIPGFNTGDADIAAICRVLEAMGVTQVELLPFHRLGSGKYEALGLRYPYRDCAPLSKEALRVIAAQYRTHFSVLIEGEEV
jgi:pyruvate formate lyase activating enzyme